jgi:flagellar hook-associated protein 3 FlgL
MISRISDNMRFDTIVGNLGNLQNSVVGVLQQLTTEKRINQPSDDPEGTTTVLGLRAAGASIEQYKENIVNGKTWLKTTEINLEAFSELLSQVLAVAQNLDSASADRTTAADSIQNFSDQMLSLANAQLNGRYMFAGSITDTKPFTNSTSGYQGDDQSLRINVGQYSSLGYNITGDSVFTFTNAAGITDDIFQTLDNLKTVLQDPSSTNADVSTAVTSLTDATEHVQGQVEDNITKVAAILSNLEFADNHLTDLKNRVANMLSNTEDADVNKLAVEYQMQLLALNASYSVATKIEESSLLNFLS